MRRFSASDIVLKVLGLLLLTAAVLKGHELLTVPMANKNLWSWRPFLILQVQFELAMGIWLLSGVFKSMAWLASLTCFTLFCCITFYKALTGAASCGCFGRIHVNPWITLAVVDLPAVAALSLFRPLRLWGPFLSFLRRQESLLNVVREYAKPLAPSPRSSLVIALGLLILGTTIPILAFHEPPPVTPTYEVLEPETWVGRSLPVIEYIDIADQLAHGTWLLLFYHHDCPDCQKAISRCERAAQEQVTKAAPLRIALIEVPPYGSISIPPRVACTWGQLAATKEWFLTTPAAVLIQDARVTQVGQEEVASVIIDRLTRVRQQ